MFFFLKYWMNIKPEIKSFIVLDIFFPSNIVHILLVYSVFLHSKMTRNYCYRVHSEVDVVWGLSLKNELLHLFFFLRLQRQAACENSLQAKQCGPHAWGNPHFPPPASDTAWEAMIILLLHCSHPSSSPASYTPHTVEWLSIRGSLKAEQEEILQSMGQRLSSAWFLLHKLCRASVQDRHYGSFTSISEWWRGCKPGTHRGPTAICRCS